MLFCLRKKNIINKIAKKTFKIAGVGGDLREKEKTKKQWINQPTNQPSVKREDI
jgi:hypothetical protein